MTMRILITNDDGWQAPGIKALADILSAKAEVVVVAPESNRSACSSSLTVAYPIEVNQVEANCYAVSGTPADCVHIAVTGILPWRPDLVVSGINQGQNLGEDTLYSGTVAGATEGFLFDIPSIAFSQVDFGWEHLDSAAKVSSDIIDRLYGQLSMPWLFNVNIPNLPYESLKVHKATRLGRRNPSPGVIRVRTENNMRAFQIGPYGTVRDAREGTDFHAVSQGWVSITPLQVDWTCYDAMPGLAGILD